SSPASVAAAASFPRPAGRPLPLPRPGPPLAAVGPAPPHPRRTHLVRFAGAYHGWWGDVQPGVGNPVSPHETYTLADMSEKTLHVLRTRRDIACVLVNPLQALHPNSNAPGDSSLIDSSRTASYDRAAYTAWLKAL